MCVSVSLHERAYEGLCVWTIPRGMDRHSHCIRKVAYMNQTTIERYTLNDILIYIYYKLYSFSINKRLFVLDEDDNVLYQTKQVLEKTTTVDHMFTELTMAKHYLSHIINKLWDAFMDLSLLLL